MTQAFTLYVSGCLLVCRDGLCLLAVPCCCCCHAIPHLLDYSSPPSTYFHRLLRILLLELNFPVVSYSTFRRCIRCPVLPRQRGTPSSFCSCMRAWVYTSDGDTGAHVQMCCFPCLASRIGMGIFFLNDIVSTFLRRMYFEF